MEQQHNKKNEDVIFGIHAVMEAIKLGKQVDKLMIKSGLKGELIKELMEVVHENQVNYQYVPIEKLNRVTRKNHQGVVAFISPISFFELSELIHQTFEKGKTPFFFLLDGVSDVRNFGAIVRSAECAGVDGIIIPEKGAARIGADAMKTSAGALHRMPVCKIGNLKKAIEYMQQSGLTVFGASEKAQNFYTAHSFTEPLCIVMGAEDTGLSDHALRMADHLIKIPILGKIESLNVSVASGVLMYEVVNQRMKS